MVSTVLPGQGTEFHKSYTSFSGVDMKVQAGKEVLSSIQALSLSITREKAPIYTMGSADPRSFSRGKRGIVGTMIFVVFDKHFLIHKAKSISGTPFLDKEEIIGSFNDTEESLGITLEGNVGVPVEDAENPLSSVSDDQEAHDPFYVDQMLPFDITMVAANEYGFRMKQVIAGVEILNEGSGFSIDDIQTEQQMTYVARAVIPWQAVSNPDLAS